MSRERGGQVWRDWFTLYGATLASQVVQGARSLAVAGLLGPQQFGLWKSLQLLLAYTKWSDLGALRGIAREVPLLRGAGRVEDAARAREAAWVLTLLPTAVITVLLVAVGARLQNVALGRGLMVFAPVLLSTRVLFYLFELANAEKAFERKSRAMVALALLDGLLAPLASWWGGVFWFMGSVALANVVVSAYLGRALRVSWRLSADLVQLRTLVAVGLPLAFSGMAFDILKTVDRFVLAFLLGTEAVGLYGLAMIVFDLTVMLPAIFGQVLLPHVVERFGKDNDGRVLFADVDRVVRVLAGVLPFALALGYILLPPATRLLLPAYAPGVPAAQILLWATFFVSIHTLSLVILVTLRRLRALIVINTLAVLLAAALCAVAVAAGFGITGVAAAMVAAYALSAVGEYVVAGLACGQATAALLLRLTRQTGPPLLAGIAAAAVGDHLLRLHPILLIAVAGLIVAPALALVAYRATRARSGAPDLSRTAGAPMDEALPLVSVVLPVRNGERFIAAAVDSILAQTYPRLELLAVDDASDDATPAILAGYRDPRLRIIRLPCRAGGTAARNTGIRNARGPLVAAMDADDVAAPERLAQQVAFLQQHPDYGMVSCAFDCIDSSGRLLDRVHPPTADGDIRAALIRANPFAHSALLARRAALEDVGLYNEGNRYAQDYDLYLRLAERWRVACLPEVLQSILIHAESETARLENLACYYDVLARLQAIVRGQYPLSSARHLARTALSMIVPLSLKQARRRRQRRRYRYQRALPLPGSPTVMPEWSGDEPAAGDAESGDWRFLLPLSPAARVLCLGIRELPLLAVAAPGAWLVADVDKGPGDAAAAGARLAFCADHLPFCDETFDVVAIELPVARDGRSHLPLREIRRVLRRGGTLHLALPGGPVSDAAQHLAAALTVLRRSAAQRRDLRLVAATLAAEGFVSVRYYGRLPGHGSPRYLLETGDYRSLSYLLRVLPTFTRVPPPITRAALWVVRRLHLDIAPWFPGVSVVARAGEP